MAESTVAKKLQLKPSYRAVVINAPPGYVELLGFSADASLAGEPEGSIDFVLLFVKDSQDIEQFAGGALKALKPDGICWLAYPKGGSKVKTDLNRDILWEKMKKFGVSGVAMISIDDVWSAMRFRQAQKVGK